MEVRAARRSTCGGRCIRISGESFPPSPPRGLKQPGLPFASARADARTDTRDSRSLEILKPHFEEDILEVQDPWASDERAKHLLTLLEYKEHKKALNDALQKKWDSSPDRPSAAKWADINTLAKNVLDNDRDSVRLRDAKQEVVLEYTYPRLDIEVSKKLNHLLKSPFVVHPGTGRVCVPIDTKHLDDFNPLDVPTIQGLLSEIDSWSGEDGDDGEVKKEAGKPMQDWEKTSLKPYVDYFRGFVTALMKDERDPKVKRERDDEGMDF